MARPQWWTGHCVRAVHAGQLSPPSRLMWRVAGNDDAAEYARVGTNSAAALMTAVDAWSLRPVASVLDWGCGCGRVTAHLLYPVITGCDPDAEAVNWCQENLQGSFSISPLYPPLPYKDESFDAVLACSVFTHLSRRTQLKWLRELYRVLRPGGVLVASVHGKAAAESFGVLEEQSIDDHYLNLGLVGVVPDGYYRDVLQSQAYTRMAWSGPFDVVAYEEAAVELQDLVVCRRK